MLGAIIGDMVGAPFEFDNGSKTREFELFTKRSSFTDDTVMTIAVADALMSVLPDEDDESVKKALVSKMKFWGRKYPDAGYGGRFYSWLFSESEKPYGSCGNGSAMRVSPAGWLYATLEKTEHMAELTAEVTHNHPEGIKAAKATAAAMFLARAGYEKVDIRKYIEQNYGYDLSRTLDEIRPGYYHIELAQNTVPEALTCFFEAESYESTLRNVMYIGGDTDTLGAIAGAVAEAFYGVPEKLKEEAKKRLPSDMMEVLLKETKCAGIDGTGREVTFDFSFDDSEGGFAMVDIKVFLTEEQIKRMVTSYVDRKTTDMTNDDNIFDIYCEVCDAIMCIKEAEGLPTDVFFENYVSFPKEIDELAGINER